MTGERCLAMTWRRCLAMAWECCPGITRRFLATAEGRQPTRHLQ
jgi:hypothetical protein